MKRSFLTRRPRPTAGAIVAIAIILVVLIVPWIPGASELLQWKRLRPSGERSFDWLTGHLVHWSWNHLVWDLVVFGLLSFVALRLIPSRVIPCFLLAALLIPLEIALLQPQFATYRGLSGIDSALFGLIVAALWNRPGSRPRMLALVGAFLFLAKSFAELRTGEPLFVSTHDSAFLPAFSAHLVGFACGLLAGLVKPAPRVEVPCTPPLPLNQGETKATRH